MNTTNERTKALKKALKSAGYPVTSCAHGRGTGYGWIHVEIDDYDQKIKNGHKIRQYEEIQKLAYEITKDDRVNIRFLKSHTCAECLVSHSCQQYHTPESCACGGFYGKDEQSLQEQEHQKYLADLEYKKANPIKISFYDGIVEVQNQIVNCGAIFTITQARYDELVKQGKTSVQIFDHLAYEDELEKKAEQYRKECEQNREKAGHPWVYDGQGHRDNIGGPLPDAMIKDLDPHGVKEITITRGEGPCDLCDKPHYFDTWESARSWLYSQSPTFPKGGCYDKHNFKVVFNDGEDYSGRLDCKHHSEPDNDLDVRDHILSFCTFQAGRAKATWCGPEEYQKIMAKKDPAEVQKYGEFIDTYLFSGVPA